MVITDADLEPPGPRILAVNPAFTEITGYSAEEALGQNPRFLQGPRTEGSVLRRIRPTLESGATFEGETYNYRKNGDEFLMRWYITPITGDGGRNVTHYLAVQRDVTEDRQLQTLAQTLNSMENLGYVFAGVRHELGNPLNSAKAALTFLRQHVESLPKGKVAAYLDAALAEMDRMEYLMKTLRSFTSHELVTVRATAMEPFLEQFVSVLRVSFEDRQATLDLRVPGDPGKALADPRALHQVLLNLVSNAVDAVEGCIAPTVTLEVRRWKEQLHLTVLDNGVGMSGEQQENLFKPFHTSKVHGTGLGLVLSRKLTAQMGGTLEIISQRGAGTAATVRLRRVS